MSELKNALNTLNQQLKNMGIPELAIVKPTDCLPQKVNARYFKAEVMNQLIENIKKAGQESVPLVYRSTTNPGKYHIISGHHRIDAFKAAGLENCLVMICEPSNKDEVVSKQLSHNALVGEDDKILLAKLFEGIEEISWKVATGLNDAISKINYSSLNFKVGSYKEFSVLFLPEDEEMFDDAIEKVAEEMQVNSKSVVRLTSIEYYSKFASAIRKIKKVDNIKSNGTALMRLVELANEKLKEYGKSEQQQTA